MAHSEIDYNNVATRLTVQGHIICQAPIPFDLKVSLLKMRRNIPGYLHSNKGIVKIKKESANNKDIKVIWP